MGLEGGADGARPQRVTVDLAEDKAVVAIGVVASLALGFDGAPPGGECGLSGSDERYPAGAGPRLGALGQQAGVLAVTDLADPVLRSQVLGRGFDDGLPDDQTGVVVLQVCPSQATQLRATQTRVRGQLVEGRESVLATCSRKRAVCSGSQMTISLGAAAGMASIRPSAGLAVMSPRRWAADSAARSVRR